MQPELMEGSLSVLIFLENELVADIPEMRR